MHESGTTSYCVPSLTKTGVSTQPPGSGACDHAARGHTESIVPLQSRPRARLATGRSNQHSPRLCEQTQDRRKATPQGKIALGADPAEEKKVQGPVGFP